MRNQVTNFSHQVMSKGLLLGLTILCGLLLLATVLFAVRGTSQVAYADPIEPPEGYPKLNLSSKVVTPTLAHTGGVTLYYAIEILNTGAYTAAGTTRTDDMPQGTTYNGDAQSSVYPQPTLAGCLVACRCCG